MVHFIKKSYAAFRRKSRLSRVFLGVLRLERMRQVLGGGSALSQVSLASFWVAFMEPSTCSASQTRGCWSWVSLSL